MIQKYKLIEMLAYEAFIRRAAEIDMPFILKGSYLTRQYFDNPLDRIPGDLDWVCIELLPDIQAAEKFFSQWATAVTECIMYDGAAFRSFKENSFWRMIDYAMADDFPTVNTDLCCIVDGEEFKPMQVDVSFNLKIDTPAIPLLYRPLRGEPFTVPYTVPLSLQVSWKLHQTLVRPRFKDIFDLIHLLARPEFDSTMQRQSLQALKSECAADNTDISQLNFLLSGNLERLFRNVSANEAWDYWRHQRKSRTGGYYSYPETAETITNAELLPSNLSVFKAQFIDALKKAGFEPIAVDNLSAVENEPNNNLPLRKVNLIESPGVSNPVRKSTGFFGFIHRLFK